MPRDSAKPTQQAHTATPIHAGRSHDGVEDPAPPEASHVRAELEERRRRHTYLLSLPRPTPTRCPKARDDEAIVAQDVLDEYVVYDLLRHKVHALNPTAATVWHWCDGQTPLEELTGRLGTELALDRERAEPLLYLALDRLERAKLLGAPRGPAGRLSDRASPPGAGSRGGRPPPRHRLLGRAGRGRRPVLYPERNRM